ncbi:FlgN protein [compost metagenome]
MSVQGLIEALEQLSERYTALYEISQDKKQAIISNDYDGLVKVLSNESKLLKVIEAEEQQLQDSAQVFLQSKGIKSRLELTITDILRLVFDPEEKQGLTASQRALNEQLTKLKQANELNQDLIAQSLNFIDFSLNVMIGGMDEEATYSPPQSSERKSSARSNFDTRA